MLQDTNIKHNYSFIYSLAVTSADISKLARVLHSVRPRWKTFGVALGVKFEAIQSIERTPRRITVEDKMIDMLHEYKAVGKREGGKTWSNVVEALRAIDNNALADKFSESLKKEQGK